MFDGVVEDLVVDRMDGEQMPFPIHMAANVVIALQMDMNHSRTKKMRRYAAQ
jgi:hypothetical protein